MSKYYKTQWFGRSSEYPNMDFPKDEFYENIRRVEDNERIAVEKYMMQEYNYGSRNPQQQNTYIQADMNLHPYYARYKYPHHHCQDNHPLHHTNDDVYCDYWNPTEKDIVDVKGYNATNIRIMHQVSKRIADLTKLLTAINDLGTPLDLNYIQCKCPAIDSSLFRTILSVAFTELLKEDMALNQKLQELLNFVPNEKKETDPTHPSCGCCKPKTEHEGDDEMIHRPNYSNYSKLSEEFVRKILKEIYKANNWEEIEEQPIPECKEEECVDPVLPNPGTGLIDPSGTVPTEGKPVTPTPTLPIEDNGPTTPTLVVIDEGTEPTEGIPGTINTQPIEPSAIDSNGVDLLKPPAHINEIEVTTPAPSVTNEGTQLTEGTAVGIVNTQPTEPVAVDSSGASLVQPPATDIPEV